ncbi:MAG: hypothetical protein QNK16_13570 [Woeseiaceae bacterium]|nr:hypothetical protein [Woeseiaceae bacterium]MDX2609408.1 hypothetical protein [Woeseiaceae bacterium]
MKEQEHKRGSIRTFIGRATSLILGTVVAISASAVVQAQGVSSPMPVQDAPMSEALRASITKVVLKPGESPVNEEVDGTYRKSTYGITGGMVAGSDASTIRTEVGPVNLSIPIPILQLPGMIAGGIAGATQSEIQKFRDALAKDLVEASSQQLVNEKIASDVYFEIREAPNLEPDLFARETPVPVDTDAILYVGIRDLTIDVDGNEAIITATATATMHRRSDETDVYETTIQYQDRDTLSNWTKNDNAVWRDYANFARHYFGREITAQVFDSAALAHTLIPLKSSSVRVSKRNRWDGTSKSLAPTLAWELSLPGSDADSAWAAGIDETKIHYDLEIYDLHRPVYSMKQIQGPQHTVTANLEACRSYRWSVRPSYHVGGDIKYGPWMRSDSNPDGGNGNVGQKASEAPAFLYDFASLEIKCGSK